MRRSKRIEHFRVSNEQGLTLIGGLFLILVLGAVTWLGYHVIPFFYYNQELVGYIESQARKSQVFSDEEIRRNILRKLKDLEIPFEDPDLLKINRFNGEMVIELEYSEVLFFDYAGYTKDLWVFDFPTRVAAPL
ncbi:MAG: hypothetical protein IT290_13370 [Deltaproteobacteria bacterium]|nr:hypothetical protein [Deltaproteobacteria bacterium]